MGAYDFSEDAARKQFDRVGLGELLECWEDPMPDEIRAVLMEELTGRGYRTKSLSTPPDASAYDVHSPGKQPTQLSRAWGQVRTAGWLGVAIAVLGGAAVGIAILGDAQGENLMARMNDPYNFIDSALFALLGMGTLRASRFCAVSLLVLYAFEQFVQLWFEVIPSLLGLGVIVLFLFLFIRGASSAFVVHRLRTPEQVPRPSPE